MPHFTTKVSRMANALYSPASSSLRKLAAAPATAAMAYGSKAAATANRGLVYLSLTHKEGHIGLQRFLGFQGLYKGNKWPCNSV